MVKATNAMLAALERRKAIYETKRARAAEGELSRDMESTFNYSRADLFQHAAEAMGYAIEDARDALQGESEATGPAS